MAKAEMVEEPKRPDVILTLSAEEADTLYSFLIMEEWPSKEECIKTLNGIYSAMADLDGVDQIMDFNSSSED